jgi:hypothetical protein
MARIFLLDKAKVEEWLDKHVPTRMEHEAAYLQAYSDGFGCPRFPPRLKHVYNAKERLGKRLIEGPDPDVEAVARAAGLLCGKWLLHVAPAHVDRLWRDVVLIAVRGNALGPVSVKVASAALARAHETHPEVFSLCVYVADGFDKARAMEVVAAMKQHLDLSVLADPVLRFKLDVHTELDCSDGSFLYNTIV